MMRVPVPHSSKFYEDYYIQQVGGNLPAFQGAYYQRGYGRRRNQRGRGIGGILSGLFRSALPMIKAGAKSVGKELVNSGIGLIGDVVRGKPVKAAATRRIKMAGHNLVNKGLNQLNNAVASKLDTSLAPPPKRGRKRGQSRAGPGISKKTGKKRRRVLDKDIFSL